MPRPIHNLSTNNEENKLFSFLRKHFSNGFRVNDYIELVKFRNLIQQDFGRSIKKEITDELLTGYISKCGIFFEGKIYPVPDAAKVYLKKIINNYFESGARIIFYEEFYLQHKKYLYENSIISEGMTKQLIDMLLPSIYHTSEYFGSLQGNISKVIEKEIVRVCDINILVDFNKISEKLHYIPSYRIQQTLTSSDNFIYDCENSIYINLKLLDINHQDCERILQNVRQICRNDGFIAIKDVPLGNLEERNYQLSESALRLAVFYVCLADFFDKKGRIISFKGQQLDVRSIIRAYLCNVEYCSLSDLENIAVELNASSRPGLILDVGNAAMVRIDKDNFVSDKFLHFDVNGVDEAITCFMTGDYMPLKSFTTFGIFPDCGYIWNLFLLESYCRRFSRMFRFDSLTFNSSNTGAIIRKSNSQSYFDIMVDAVLCAGVGTTAESVGHFLIGSGYIARNSATVNEIAVEAKTRRERDD